MSTTRPNHFSGRRDCVSVSSLPGRPPPLSSGVGHANMKTKFRILLIAEVLCLAFLLELIRTPFTVRAAVAQGAYTQNPTEENRRRYEEARKQDQQNLKVQRVLCGVALILITSLLWRTAVRARSGPVRPGSAQQPDGPANVSQPIRSETNPPPPAAGSRR